MLAITPTAYVPTTAPLQYITFPAVLEYVFENTESILANSLLPVDGKDYIAIFISEGVSGALGGALSKLTTLIDGNKNNRESVFANAEISGAYFGVTGAVRSLAQIAGNNCFYTYSDVRIYIFISSQRQAFLRSQ